MTNAPVSQRKASDLKPGCAISSASPLRNLRGGHPAWAALNCVCPAVLTGREPLTHVVRATALRREQGMGEQCSYFIHLKTGLETSLCAGFA